MTNLLLALSLGAVVCNAWAQPVAYPNKPVHLIVGFRGRQARRLRGAGDGRRSPRPRARPADHHRQPPGRRVEHRRPDGRQGAAPDGYTMLIASPSSISVNPAMNPKIGLQARNRSRGRSARSAASPLLLAVHPSLGVSSVRELDRPPRRSRPASSTSRRRATARRRISARHCSSPLTGAK